MSQLIPIQLDSGVRAKPIVLMANNVAIPIQLTSGLILVPIKLELPQEPAVSTLDFALDSPMV